MFAKAKLLALAAAALNVVEASPLSPLNNRPPVVSVTSFIPSAIPTRTCGTTNTITLTLPYGGPAPSGAVPSDWPEPSGSWSWPEPSGSWSWPEPSGSWSWPEPSGFPSASVSGSVRPTAFPSGSISRSVRPTAFPSGSGTGSVGGPSVSVRPTAFPSGSGTGSVGGPSVSVRPTAFPSGSGTGSVGGPSVSVRPTSFPSGSFSYPGPRPTGYPGYPYPSGIESSYAWPYPSGQPEYSSGIYYPSGIASSADPAPTHPGVTNTYPSGTWSPDCSVVVTVTQHLPGPSTLSSRGPYPTARPTAF